MPCPVKQLPLLPTPAAAGPAGACRSCTQRAPDHSYSLALSPPILVPAIRRRQLFSFVPPIAKLGTCALCSPFIHSQLLQTTTVACQIPCAPLSSCSSASLYCPASPPPAQFANRKPSGIRLCCPCAVYMPQHMPPCLHLPSLASHHFGAAPGCPHAI